MLNIVIWAPLANHDFENILEYLLSNWDQKTVNKFIENTEFLINQIKQNSKQFPLINNKLKVRKCVLTKHNSLFYSTDKNIISILRIYDTRQNPKTLRYR